MIIHHSENLDEYHLCINKPLKYSDKFTFIPIKLQRDNSYLKCIFQTPMLFTPFGIQFLMNGKRVIDLSFHNKENDKSQLNFLKTMNHIYQCVNHKYKDSYKVNEFLKVTDFNECIRLKLNDNTSLYDENKNRVPKINQFTYGFFIIELEGIWLNENNIWFQWNLLQGKVKTPTHLCEYSFIDDININIKSDKSDKPDKYDKPDKPDKYDKMLKLGVPLEAVNMQRKLDSRIPPPPHPPHLPHPPHPPHPPPPPCPMFKGSNGQQDHDNGVNDVPKISASDLRSVVLKKRKIVDKKIIRREPGSFEPPTLEELQTTLSRLRKTK